MAPTRQTVTDEQRKSVALPDYAGKDTARYRWLCQRTG